jgi:uncharacterized protein YjbI with pentapeptide repeats
MKPGAQSEARGGGLNAACEDNRHIEEPGKAIENSLREHELWLASWETKGRRANFSEQDLRGLNLGGASLRQAQLVMTLLAGAELVDADLREAFMSEAVLDDAYLDAAKLNDADLRSATLRGACMASADLTGAFLTCADREKPDKCTDLTGADLTDAELKDARFDGANVAGVVFEPLSIPNVRSIATAHGLERLTYRTQPNALFELRKRFEENGYRLQERQIVYALKRREAELANPWERWFNTIAFDWTSQYGMSPGRPVRIWVGLFAVCWAAYLLCLHLPGTSGIYRVTKVDATDEHREQRIRFGLLGAQSVGQFVWRAMIRESRLAFWAAMYSAMSAFNIGFRDVDLGRWLRLLPRTEYELKAKGWVRTVSGFQSLISVYMMALWALTYFGRPF